MNFINPDIALKKLDRFRKKMAKGEIQPGCPDWIVRMCQGHIAVMAGYPDRATCYDCVNYPRGGRGRGECTPMGEIVRGSNKDRECFRPRSPNNPITKEAHHDTTPNHQ